MKTSDFYYDLPKELIAQTPVYPRDSSRLMVLNKKSGDVSHHHFYDLVDILKKGDTLILNDSRVLPARLYGKTADTDSNMEILLLVQKDKNKWETLVKPGKKARVGREFIFGNGLLKGKVDEVMEDGNRIMEFSWDDNRTFFDVIEEIGTMPLPPYITEKLEDQEMYQTVYSKELGSAAAPTAGLHFTDEMLEKLKAKGVNLGYVTLHVGLGTFRPVKVDDVTKHHMHSEHYYMPKETADLINKTKAEGGRVISVGTTSCRTMESVWQKEGCVKESEGWTEIFIYPGYKFGVMDALITNFHLPESTLIMLVSAFAGFDYTMNAYKVAVDEKYRFFSFGDAMFITE